MYGFILVLIAGLLCLVSNSLLRSMGYGVIGDALTMISYVAIMFGLKLGGYI